ncbi:MAG: GH3 auxin-responsive promoter family protein, partial [Salibacteraceae bacterium]|nr:GH3 auxin-responsive promoter family protein [Salibacteraceae bacterium]
FTSLDPFRIKVSGRTKHFINAFGEELIVDNAEKAMAKACAETGAKVRDYTAAPVYMQNKEAGAHEWAIEFDEMPADMNQFAVALDQAIKALNSDYEAKRFMDKILKMPIIRAVPRETFYTWMKSRNKLGGQNKVPRLSNNRDYMEQILEIANA